MMLDPAEFAALEEHRISTSVSEVAHRSFSFTSDHGGGTVCSGDPGTWANSALGLGMCGPVPHTTIEQVIEFHSAAGAEPRVEVCPYAHHSLLAALAERQFVLRSFESVLARPLDDSNLPQQPHIPGLVITEINSRDAERVAEYSAAVSQGFAAPHTPRHADIELAARCARHHRSITFGASIDGSIVGAGSLEWFKTERGALAALYALSVLPEFRRRGIQQALIAARLAAARRLGCTCATIGSAPGSATERNARRAGFALMYTKVVVVRPAPALTPAN